MADRDTRQDIDVCDYLYLNAGHMLDALVKCRYPIRGGNQVRIVVRGGHQPGEYLRIWAIHVYDGITKLNNTEQRLYLVM